MEWEIELEFIKQLEQLGYTKVKVHTEDDLKTNFRTQLSEFNKDKLGTTPLTMTEFNKVLTHLEGKNIFNSATMLRDKFELERDNGEEIYIEFLNMNTFEKNIYQVASQIEMKGKYNNRYDVTLLINGLPLVQIELKRNGIELKQAFNQIERYRRHSYRGLFAYIQLFVVSNGVDTKYFSNTNKLNFEYTFFWSDEENNRITQLEEFTDNFLTHQRLSNVISKYMIVNATNQTLLVMRPYQIYAVEAILNNAKNTTENGYIWHTTGSGKTLTSFKASQILSKEPDIKKVFFLIDRKDLDSQTVAEFNRFEKDCVDPTDKTATLITNLQDSSKKLIVTTIQKLANAIKSSKYTKIMDKYKDDKVVFIIDECHRSQFGLMHTAVQKHFANSQYFGFTGTPRFEENKSQEGRVTADLFGKCLHNYLIKNAIKDNNVLGFSVEYYNTIKGNFTEDDPEQVHGIDTDEVMMSDERLTTIANHIVEIHDLKTNSKKYTAILAVQNIPMLIKYYDIFKTIEHELKIAAIFTFGANEDSEEGKEHSKDSLERIIDDYNGMFNKNYSTETYGNYFSDVSKRVKNASIDILIVVKMFLTGFDSKTLNTLYVDKKLKYHDLLQAYSRTNRVESVTKPHGNIVCYQNLKTDTDDAIRLFSQTNDTETVLMGSYDEYVQNFVVQLANLHTIVATPSDVDTIEGEAAEKEFIVAFRELSKTLTKLQTFTEFEFTDEHIGIDAKTYEKFKGKYLLIYDREKRRNHKDKASILADIDFSIALMHTDKINVDYILNLIKDIDTSDDDQRDKDVKNIMGQLENADNEELRLKVDLIKDFLTTVIPTLTPDHCIDEEFEQFEKAVQAQEISMFAQANNLTQQLVLESIEEYSFSNIINEEKLSKQITGGFKEKRNKATLLRSFIKEQAEKYQTVLT
ncbi:MAG: restriction endonuclease subunit R [Epulopiscium sp. Nele67-Bin004]|nr:MAG: restriction endonuclease subunit R [Epulopiscium sp. Nele67-Bin004]